MIVAISSCQRAVGRRCYGIIIIPPMRPRPVRDEVPVLVIGIGGAVDVRHRVRIRVAGSLVSLVAVGALVALAGDVS